MRLDFRSPSTYLALALCFLVGFFSFFIFRSMTLSTRTSSSGSTTAEPQPSKRRAGRSDTDGNESRNQVGSRATGFEGQPLGEDQSQSGQPTEAQPNESAAVLEEPEIADPVQSVAFPRVETGVSNASASNGTGLVASLGKPAIAFSRQPKYEIAWADPSNYGDRYKTDIYKRPANNRPIIVLHETVGSASSVISYFKTYHANDADQASYHTMVRRNGTVVYLVPPEKRAFGAGNSVFVTEAGEQEAVKTHKKYPPSVNNFAYHISLESPPDGYGNEAAHSGYTQSQYDSLAWLIGQSTVPLNRITTHKAVDRSGSRSDPRSFEVNRLISALRPYR